MSARQTTTPPAGTLPIQQRFPGASVDFVIAATAQLLEADLATANVRHYPMFAGLGAPYGTQ
jgi:predicted nucleic acid-binding protein